MNNYLQIINSVAIDAGKAIMKIYNTDFDVEYKTDDSPLTLADKTANEVILSVLKEEFPSYAILSEESKDSKDRLESDYCFIVDPLDGTKEFIKRNGQFTVNIALTYKGKSVLGVIYVPVSKMLYYASEGAGAYIVNVESGESRKLNVSDRLDKLTWVGSKSHSSEKEENLIKEHSNVISEIISAGSSLKGCMVAEGKADVYYRFGLTCEWDTAAMQCIVEESGGIFRQLDGSEMTYNRKNNLNEKGFYIVNRVENVWV